MEQPARSRPRGSAFSMTLSHYKPLIGYSCFVALIYAVLSFTYHFIDFKGKEQLLTLFMAGWLLWMPVLAGYCYFHNQLFVKEPTSFKDALFNGFSKILPLLVTLVGIMLLPALVAGIIALVAILAVKTLDTVSLWSLIGATAVLSILIINRNLLSLIIVSLSSTESTQAMTHASQLIKGSYWRVMFRSTLAFLVLIALYSSPIWIDWFAQLDPFRERVLIAFACFDIIFIAPFFWSMMILDLHALEHKLLTTKPPQRPQTEQKQDTIKNAPKGEMKDQDWF